MTGVSLISLDNSCVNIGGGRIIAISPSICKKIINVEKVFRHFHLHHNMTNGHIGILSMQMVLLFLPLKLTITKF